MGLLDTLLSLVGRGGSSTEDDRRETTVSVEREADTDTEAAVKGTDEASREDPDEAVAAGTSATASTESLVDEADEETGSAAEPAEAAGPDADTPETELDTAASESEDESTGEHEGDGPDSVETIKGIGPAYAERLSKEGVHTVAELADADAAELAAAIDLSEKRVGTWIERASDR